MPPPAKPPEYEFTVDLAKLAVAQPPPLKVAIVGFSDTSRDLAPYDDESFEIWTLGTQMRRAKRVTRGFELHSEAYLQRVHGDGWPEYKALMQGLKCPLYMQAESPDYPTSIAYPLERASKAAFGIADPFGERKPLWTNSIQYMLVLAALEGATDVHVYGVDMSHRLEYVLQRHGVTFILGLMMGRGINIYLPPMCGLLHSDHVYGYQEQPTEILDEVTAFARARHEETRNQHLEHMAKLHSLDGYTQAMADVVEFAEERQRGGRAKKVTPREVMR